MYDKIYEISKFPFPEDAIIMLIFTIGFAFFFIERLYYFMVNVKKISVIKKFFIIILLLVLLIVTVLGITFLVDEIKNGGSENYYYSKIYYAGNYEKIEGIVKNFKSKITTNGENRHQEMFQVGNIKFVYNDAFKFGFLNSKGDINRDGQKVRIYYIPTQIDDEEIRNVIVRVDLKTE